ncbi:helix-turn-helix DNA binding domain protein [Streptomyces phage Araceli]|nr:helix-turn-helix DNA binding domain protein [Streptomyces phage Henoccus]AWY07365.1 helix-turn-helix DNA binding domain protein [Streptomyces phage JackieB]QFG07861.1 helix-turn-helix DNA binding domain protein [Streptomyces phage Araceli]
MKTPEQLARAKYTAYLRETGRATKVPVGPVRDYLRKLHFAYGMSCAQLSEKCALSQGSISEIIQGERRGDRGQIYTIREIFRENAESVMMIEPEIPTERGGARVNAIGTTRRIQGLAAEGFPVRWVGEQVGFIGQTFYLTAQGKRKIVYFSTAYKIKCLYEKLENDLHPEFHGIDPGKAKLARTYAARNGYVRPIFWDWDTIDDPDGFPDFTGACGTPQGSQAHRRKGILPVCQPCKDAVAAQRREQRGV